ncbi:MAG: uracil-DNA glycosylase family protein [Alphaproteobacteria bacterium]|nr:uracil-DNA glycosylase family protein [Alphaproteobacteria bacterium]
MNPQENTAHALDSLRWYAEMGVDVCVEATPQPVKKERAEAILPPPAAGGATHALSRDSLAEARTGRATRTPDGAPLPLTQGGGTTPPPSLAAAVAEARQLADAAHDLTALEEAVRGFTGCALKKTATTTVFAQGVAASRVMFIGEAPGAEEDRNGVPFCGPSGQLLDRMLGFIGLTRTENFYITNALFWRPPGNRQPSKEELAICRPFVEKHIALINPRLLVLVGGTATSAILGDTRGITRLRGQVFTYRNDYMPAEVPVHVLYHPSYLLRQPLAKKQAWADILKLKMALTH